MAFGYAKVASRYRAGRVLLAGDELAHERECGRADKGPEYTAYEYARIDKPGGEAKSGKGLERVE